MKCIILILCLLVFFPVFAQKKVSPAKKSQPPSPISAPAKAKTKVSPASTAPVYVPLVRTDLDPERFENPAEAEKLFAQRLKLMEDMQKTRVHIVNTDKEAQKMKQQIMELSRKLTILIESKNSMKEYNQELVDLDKKIDAMPLKKNKGAK